jgi:aminoglycoside phosphotransferase (APT) family kinase protein
VAQPDGIDGELVDFGALLPWMDRCGLPGGSLDGAELLPGGTQNVLVRFSRGGREYVLRRPPRHPRLKSNDALRREMRVLEALRDTDVPHPRLLAACPDESVLGVAFYLMSLVRGFNCTRTLPRLHASAAALRHQMGLEAVEALARLGAVDHTSGALTGVGRPEGFLERQVGQWRRQLERYSELPGYPGPQVPGVDEVARWLEQGRPDRWRPGVMHGDFHVANLLFAWDSPRVAAIVDWEMATVGDPLLDLGWMLATWPDARGWSPLAEFSGFYDRGGLASREELIERYAACSDRDLSLITWYTVLACFKLGIVLEGTHARACAGQAEEEVGDRLHAACLALLDRARELIGQR